MVARVGMVARLALQVSTVARLNIGKAALLLPPAVTYTVTVVLGVPDSALLEETVVQGLAILRLVVVAGVVAAYAQPVTQVIRARALRGMAEALG
jgi:hypothetical protein